jgi:hypothetical protein
MKNFCGSNARETLARVSDTFAVGPANRLAKTTNGASNYTNPLNDGYR